MQKKRLIFDIALFSVSKEMSGIPRVAYEFLKRFLDQDDFDITLICSTRDEEAAWRNVNHLFGRILPFQSREVENYSLPEQPTKPHKTSLRRCEDLVRLIFKNRFLDHGIEAARKVKWFFRPPPPPPIIPPRSRSRFLENLVRQSDVYFSPFYPVVPEADANSEIKKIQIVYDIIPAVFPQWYPKDLLNNNDQWSQIDSDTAVLSISENTKKDLVQHFPQIRPDQVAVISLGADPMFAPSSDRKRIAAVLKKYGVPNSGQYILSVATLEIRKNFDHVIRSFRKFVEMYGEEFPDVNLVLTGKKGWLDEKINRSYAETPRKIRRRILLTGYVDDEDLPFIYCGASCFCYMSLYEGFGLPPLEAMQCGTPTVSSNTSSIPEVVGDAGILLDPQDEQGLVEAFRKILEDKEFRDSLIEKGLNQARKFQWDFGFNTMINIIDKNDE